MRPNVSHLGELGIDRRAATNLAMIAQAAAGKTVLSVSARRSHAEIEFRAILELVHALGLEVNGRSLRITFESGGVILFIGNDYQRRLEGLRPDIVDGVHLLPVHADIWRASGVDAW